MAGGGLPPKRLPSLFLVSSPSFLGGGRAADDFEAGGAAVLGPPKMAPHLFLKLSSEDALFKGVKEKEKKQQRRRVCGKKSGSGSGILRLLTDDLKQGAYFVVGLYEVSIWHALVGYPQMST